jgi:hypothetical protein
LEARTIPACQQPAGGAAFLHPMFSQEAEIKENTLSSESLCVLSITCLFATRKNPATAGSVHAVQRHCLFYHRDF